jgi:hypothetical protein
MEKMIEKKKQELLKISNQYLPGKNEHLDNDDWTYINAILKSNFGGQSNIEDLNYPELPLLTPEGVKESAPAPRKTSIKFNQKIN